MMEELEDLRHANNQVFLQTQRIIHLLPKTFISDLVSLRDQIKQIKQEIK